MSELNQGELFNTFSVKDVNLVNHDAIPASVFDCPGMILPEERELLYSLARNHFSGAGRIVDAGLFLGASTICFGQGIRDGKGVAGPSIDGFDRAIVTPHMVRFLADNGILPELEADDSLVERVESETRDYADLVTFHFGDILDFEWNSDLPIEICFLDILKNYKINRHCFQTFFGSFVPGSSILIQQDYFYHNLPFVKVYQEYLADFFEYLGECHTSAVFRCTASVPPGLLNHDLYRTLSAEEILYLHDKACTRTADAGRRFMCALSRARLTKMIFGIKSARRAFHDIEERYAAVISQSTIASEVLEDVRNSIFKKKRRRRI